MEYKLSSSFKPLADAAKHDDDEEADDVDDEDESSARSPLSWRSLTSDNDEKGAAPFLREKFSLDDVGGEASLTISARGSCARLDSLAAVLSSLAISVCFRSFSRIISISFWLSSLHVMLKSIRKKNFTGCTLLISS